MTRTRLSLHAGFWADLHLSAVAAVTVAEMFDKRVINDSTCLFHHSTNVPDLCLSGAEQARSWQW